MKNNPTCPPGCRGNLGIALPPARMAGRATIRWIYAPFTHGQRRRAVGHQPERNKYILVDSPPVHTFSTPIQPIRHHGSHATHKRDLLFPAPKRRKINKTTQTQHHDAFVNAKTREILPNASTEGANHMPFMGTNWQNRKGNLGAAM